MLGFQISRFLILGHSEKVGFEEGSKKWTCFSLFTWPPKMDDLGGLKTQKSAFLKQKSIIFGAIFEYFWVIFGYIFLKYYIIFKIKRGVVYHA